MRTGEENSTAEHAALALYLLGALDEVDRVAFEAHLAGCWECLSAAGEMGSVTSALPGLDAADWEAVAPLPPEFLPVPDPRPGGTLPSPDSGPAVAAPTPDPGFPGTPPSPNTGPAAAAPTPSPPADPGGPAGPPVPGSVAASDGTAPGSATDPDGLTGIATPDGPTGLTAQDPADPGPGVAGAGIRRVLGRRAGGAVRPTGGRPRAAGGSGTRPSTGPGRSPGGIRRRGLMLWAGAAAAVLAVVIAGGVVAGIGSSDRDGVVLTATGEAPGQGVSLSVTITTEESGSTIRITANGLRQGLRYRLFGVTRDGATHVVRDWTASTGPQEVTAELSLPVDDLAFVTVGLVDGTAIVTAPIYR